VYQTNIKIQEGDHANIATKQKNLFQKNTADDKGWTQPNDQISWCGLTHLNIHLDKEVQFSTSTNRREKI